MTMDFVAPYANAHRRYLTFQHHFGFEILGATVEFEPRDFPETVQVPLQLRSGSGDDGSIFDCGKSAKHCPELLCPASICNGVMAEGDVGTTSWNECGAQRLETHLI